RRPRALPESRFSRTAIWGAAWALVFFAVVPAFRWHEMKTHEFETAGLLSSPLMIFVSFGILLPAFIAPLGATILGWISISQIRRSAGRLDGLGLALFDGLLFPLLALDFLIVIIAANLIPDSFDDNPHNLLVLGAMIGSGVADVFIVRRVWRTVSKSSMASAVKNAQTDFQKTTSYHPQSATSDDSGSAKRRLSSLAILGAIWGILFLPLCKFHPAAGVEFWVAYDYSQLSHLSFTRSLLIIPPMISFSAPFGMTILGWLAVRQIRRSRGRIIGLGLAVFDGLLFPLLICDVLIIVLAADLIGIEERPTGLAFVNEHFTFLDFAIVALAAALVISSNWWVSRAVWRAVSKVNTGQISTPESRGGPGASI
ncbi:MAG: serine/threonine protein kinase, partial [Verrucomicrobiales bacterium]|nr:serine/threonine protein kinase [Verrucomicrobiales bacterium]